MTRETLFARKPGQINGDIPATDALRLALGVRLLGECRSHMSGCSGEGALSLWAASIQPSFDAWAQVGVARLVLKSRTHFRGALVIAGQPESCAANFQDDPSPAFVVPSLAPDDEGGGSLDGIGYSLTVWRGSLESTFSFANPTREDLKVMERHLFVAAQRIVAASPGETAERYVALWRRYLGDRG